MKQKHRANRVLGLGIAAAIGAMALPACRTESAKLGPLQGVIEFDERVLGFEIGGRITRVNVRRGEAVNPGDVLATLDDTLECTTRSRVRTGARD